MPGADRNVTIRANSTSAYPARHAPVTDRLGVRAKEAKENVDAPPAQTRVTKPTYVRRLALVLGLLCLTPGCSFFYLAKRTMHYEPREYDITLEEAEACEQYAIWAEEAWSEWQSNNAAVAVSRDYYDGFRNGFVDFCFAGGSGEPPPVPPRRFWRTLYRNTAGDQSVADWSAGFRAGASAARAGGYRKRAIVPSPTDTRTAVAAEEILDGPSEYLDGTFDAGELLDAGPELVAPDAATPATETPPAEGAPPESIPDPYFRSPVENKRDTKSGASQPKSSAAQPRMLTAPIDDTPLDQVPEIEPNRRRFDDFFRLPDDGDVPEGAQGDSATRVNHAPAVHQASNRITTSNGENAENSDIEKASWVLSEPPNRELRQPGATTIPAHAIDQDTVVAPADSDAIAEETAAALSESASATKQSPRSDAVQAARVAQPAVLTRDPTPISSAVRGASEKSRPKPMRARAARPPGKNATELAKHAQTLFQDTDDMAPVYTPFSNLFTEQP